MASRLLPVTCQIHCGLPTRMTRAAFIKCCLNLQNHKPGIHRIGLEMTGAPECRDCEIGKKIKAGDDFTPPENVEFIVMESVKTAKKPEKTGLWREIPAAKLPKININSLAEYWHRPPAPAHQRGVCVCCGREMTIKTRAGLCASCYKTGKNITGPRLLEALQAAAEKFSAVPPPDRRPRKIVSPSARKSVPRKNRKKSEIFTVRPGYEPLAVVLAAALEQAQDGKGRERHASGEPFDQQKICEITRRVGLGYPLGQAIKKAEESKRLPGDMGRAELLGAINYLAAAYICFKRPGA